MPSDLNRLFVHTTEARSFGESSSSKTLIHSSFGIVAMVVVLVTTSSGSAAFTFRSPVMLRRLVSTAPPPRRRARQGPSSRAPLPPPPFVQHAVSAPVSPSDQDRFNAPLYTLKAFAIATAIVMSTATASVAGAMAYLDVRNVSPVPFAHDACVHG